MNKSKLTKLAEEVLLNVDKSLNNEIQKHLCKELSKEFDKAYFYLSFPFEDKKYLSSYKRVKPVLDDALLVMKKRKK